MSDSKNMDIKSLFSDDPKLSELLNEQMKTVKMPEENKNAPTQSGGNKQTEFIKMDTAAFYKKPEEPIGGSQPAFLRQQAPETARPARPSPVPPEYFRQQAASEANSPEAVQPRRPAANPEIMFQPAPKKEGQAPEVAKPRKPAAVPEYLFSTPPEQPRPKPQAANSEGYAAPAFQQRSQPAPEPAGFNPQAANQDIRQGSRQTPEQVRQGYQAENLVNGAQPMQQSGFTPEAALRAQQAAAFAADSAYVKTGNKAALRAQQAAAFAAQSAGVPISPAETVGVSNNVKQGSGKNPAWKKALSVLSNVLFIALCLGIIIGAAVFASSNNPNKYYFGYRIYSVTSDSMTPKEDGSSPEGGFNRGALIVVKKTEVADIVSGDIITYSIGFSNSLGFQTTGFLTHRVVDILDGYENKEGTYFITKGDHNDITDPPVDSKLLIGKTVFAIPRIGYGLEWMRKPLNFALLIVFAVSLFGFVAALRYFLSDPEKQAAKAKAKAEKGKKPKKQKGIA